ncbi:MAG TPA: cysteine desulfurase family protein [Candidatus Saccharimonadales bacterium]|nr:cysteine desulfurase family protein [Candidatus Saccharimonadales bacterium]
MDQSYIYLDYAAATPVDSDVLKEMLPFMQNNFFNPSAVYSQAVQVRRALDDARARVAHWLGAKPSEVIFTAGATEANNLAIHGIMSQYPEANVLVSAIEHESVIAPSSNYQQKFIAAHNDGRLDLEDLTNKLNDKTVLVSVMQANNEIGTIQPLKLVAKIIQLERKKRGPKGLPIYLHTDSAQAANYLDLHTSRLGVDLMSLNGGKIYGPKQTGILFIKTGINLAPQVLGGGQERGIRSGTENVSGFVGLASALDHSQTERLSESQRLTILRDNFISEIQKAIPTLIINGSLKFRLPNNIHLIIPGKDNERLLMQLDENGILAAAGSACSASNDEPSHVLKVIGKSDDEARSSIRLTLGRDTTEADLKQVLSVLKRLS